MPKPQIQAGPPLLSGRDPGDEEAREHGPCSSARATGKLRPGTGLSKAKGRELGQHKPRRVRSPGAEGRGRMSQAEASGQTNLLPSPLDPSLNTFSETPRRELAASPAPRGLLLPTLAPGTRRGSGVATSSSPLRAQRTRAQVTGPPWTLPGKEPAPGLRAKFRVILGNFPQSQDYGPSKVRALPSPKPPPPPAAAYLAPGGKGCASPSGRVRSGSVESRETGGSGSAGRTETRRPSPGTARCAETACRVRHPLICADPAPHLAPVAGRPRGPAGSLYQSCRDITRRPGPGLKGAGPRAGGGAREKGSAA